MSFPIFVITHELDYDTEKFKNDLGQGQQRSGIVVEMLKRPDWNGPQVNRFIGACRALSCSSGYGRGSPLCQRRLQKGVYYIGSITLKKTAISKHSLLANDFIFFLFFTISKVLKISQCTVQSNTQKWRAYGTTSSLPRHGRPPKLTGQEEC